MKTLSLQKDSWHYKLAKFFGWKEYTYKEIPDPEGGYYNRHMRVPGDFCSYVRRILLGMLLAIGAGILCSIVALYVLVSEYYFFTHLLYEVWILDGNLKKDLASFVGASTAINGIAIGVAFVRSIQTGHLVIFAIPKWIKWFFKWIPNPEIRIPTCEEIPLCDDTRRFIVAAYTMFHDKVCFKLSFHENGAQENDQ